MSGIVISYRRADAEGSAGRLYDRLTARYGSEFVFMDYYSLVSGEDWFKSIEDTVRRADLVLAVIGPRWSSAADGTGGRRLDDERDYVRHEIRTALLNGIRVLPVLVESAATTELHNLPTDISGLGDVEVFRLEGRSYESETANLHRFIDGVVGYGGDIPRLEDHRTAVAAFLGVAEKGPLGEPTLLTSWTQFEATFGGFGVGQLAHAVYGWFSNGGELCCVVRIGKSGSTTNPAEFLGELRGGLLELERVHEVTIIAVPDVVALHCSGSCSLEDVESHYLELIAHCELLGDRIAVLDAPSVPPRHMLEWTRSLRLDTSRAALYYPWIRVFDPTSGRWISIPPSGHIAGTWARSDAERGFWEAPANEPLKSVVDLQERLSRDESSELLRAGVNAIIALPGQGIRVWGARTLSSHPRYADLATVRVIATLSRFMPQVTSWAAFQRSTPATWARLSSAVHAVLESLWQRGALAGQTARDAFYVKCDREINAPELVAAGRIRVEFGFALSAPSDFTRMSVEQPSGSVTVFEG